MKFAVIRQEAIIDATPDEVFQAYVDPEKHAAFTGSPAGGTPRVGGTFTSWDGYITGKYTELEEGKTIVHEWTTTAWPEGYPPSIVRLVLVRKGKKTKLMMTHTKVPAAQAADYTQGWIDFYWNPLKKYFKKA